MNDVALGAESDALCWHPRLQELYRYWQSIRPGEALPGRQHFDPLALPGFLPQLWLLDVQQDPLRLRYRLLGTRITEICGRELTGLWLDEAHPHLADPHSLSRFQRVVSTGLPSRRRGRPNLFLSPEHYVEIENALFPLARDGRTVDMILAYTIFYGRDGMEFR